MPWLLLIIKHILPISELYSSFRRTDLTTGDTHIHAKAFAGTRGGGDDILKNVFGFLYIIM